MFGHRPSIYQRNYHQRSTKEDREELLDYSEKYVDFLISQSGKEGFGAIGWSIGGPDSGKSCLMCIHQNIFLESDPERKVAFYQAPETILKSIQKSAPKHIFERVRIIDKLSDVEPLDLFCIDEGYLSADAKDALQKDPRNFIKSITTLRHPGIFTFMNSLDDGILKGYRKKAQLQFFKLLPDGFIEESNIPFLKKYRDIVCRLFPEQSIFRFSQGKFLRAGLRIGILDLHKDVFCPWFTDEVSRSFANEDFDAEKRREIERMKKENKVIEDIKSKYGVRLGKPKAEKLVRGYLREKKPDLFLEFQDRLKSIMERAYYQLDEEGLFKKNVSETATLTQSEIIIPLNINEAPKWFEQYYLTNQGDPFIADIIKQWIEGISQREIAYKKSVSVSTVNRILKQYREGDNLPNDDLRLSYAFEYWVSHKTGATRGGGISQPDEWYTILNLLYPGECKLLYDESKSITLYQILPDDSNKTLRPSHEYCKLHNIPKFPLFFRNPSWGNFDMLIPVFILGENKITLFKSKINEYVQNFIEFSPKKFFEINNKKDLQVKIKAKSKPKRDKNELLADILTEKVIEGKENISIADLTLEALKKSFNPSEWKDLNLEDVKQFIQDNIPEQIYMSSSGMLSSLSNLVYQNLKKEVVNQTPKKGKEVD